VTFTSDQSPTPQAARGWLVKWFCIQCVRLMVVVAKRTSVWARIASVSWFPRGGVVPTLAHAAPISAVGVVLS
jgi:hypothetical protein